MADVAGGIVLDWFVIIAFLNVVTSTFGTFLFWRDDGVGLLEGFILGWIAVYALNDFWLGLAVKLPGV